MRLKGSCQVRDEIKGLLSESGPGGRISNNQLHWILENIVIEKVPACHQINQVVIKKAYMVQLL